MHSKIQYYDEGIKETIAVAKQVPVLINYSYAGKRYDKKPDQHDYELLEMIDHQAIPYWYPICELPEGYNTEQPKKSLGFRYVHQFYTKRNLIVMSYILK